MFRFTLLISLGLLALAPQQGEAFFGGLKKFGLNLTRCNAACERGLDDVTVCTLAQLTVSLHAPSPLRPFANWPKGR